VASSKREVKGERWREMEHDEIMEMQVERYEVSHNEGAGGGREGATRIYIYRVRNQFHHSYGSKFQQGLMS
jgi:hypothetical protein